MSITRNFGSIIKRWAHEKNELLTYFSVSFHFFYVLFGRIFVDYRSFPADLGAQLSNSLEQSDTYSIRWPVLKLRGMTLSIPMQ